MNNSEKDNLLSEFLVEWSVDHLLEMPIEQYIVGGGDHTFCYWVETKTKDLGNIKGQNSFIFGIYKRKEKSKQYQGRYKSDGEFAWLADFGESKGAAFRNVKTELLKVIDHSENGRFSLIEESNLHPFFKWKVAYLYSGQRLIPIYEKAVLNRIAGHFGLKVTKTTKISEIQEIMMWNKPAGMDSWAYTRYLWERFSPSDTVTEIENIPIHTTGIARGRRASEIHNLQTQVRTTTARTSIIDPKHQRLQLALREKLRDEFGEDSNILFEQDYVDVKLIRPDQVCLYEVKTHPYASDCIRAALGQLLTYTFSDSDERKKKLVVVGQHPPNPDDLRFIGFIKGILSIEFEYMNVDL
ncbi:MAG: hypothetical protein IT174_07380 [Acidobacteria bacterium]|nr:hypothetical protein [Acidobacteriota bacterium]